MSDRIATEDYADSVGDDVAADLALHELDTTAIHGIADTAALVLTGDSRLSNARTPTAHATSHQDGGTDELALDGSQITSGTVADERIASTLARDSEVTSAVAAEATARDTAISAAVAALINSAPGALDTLDELAAALGDDANFAATVTTALAGKQPLDSDLTALAALTTTSYGRAFLELANAAAGLAALGLDADLATLSLPASTTISTFGASLIDDAAASNARTTLGLGTAATSNTGDFDATGAAAAAQAASQPVDSDLTAIAALATTSFGRGLLALADAAAGRTALGLGTVATHAHTEYEAAGAAAAAQAASQPLDSDLTTLAGLTATTDNMIQSVGSAWASRTPAQVRAALALVIGTNVQAWDADLDTLASTITAFGKSLVDDADAATARATLGLGTNAVTNVDGWVVDTNTWTYASATTFTIAADATGYLRKGTKVSYNDGAVDYGHIAAIAFAAGTTTVTLITNSDYSIANAALSAPRYSYIENPQGFPTWFNWTPTLSGWSSNPTNTVNRYTCVGTAITISIRHQATGTSNSTIHTATLPVAAVTIANMQWGNTCKATDNGVIQTGNMAVNSAATAVLLNGIIATANNTASGASSIVSSQVTYEF